jgi:hypothetical protein
MAGPVLTLKKLTRLRDVDDLRDDTLFEPTVSVEASGPRDTRNGLRRFRPVFPIERNSLDDRSQNARGAYWYIKSRACPFSNTQAGSVINA